MRCDLHVHTRCSGAATTPVVGWFCRESYNDPEAVYAQLKRAGMDLVTVTDHDSIDALEPLRRHRDFFLSEEVTCRMPSGTTLHVGVYNLNERQHLEIQRRRDDLPSLIPYLREQNVLYSVNHIFSRLTGRRELEDFTWFEDSFPAFEVLNSHLPRANYLTAKRLAYWLGKAVVAGSDAHSLASIGSAYTDVPGARGKEEFMEGLRLGGARVGGRSGNYWILTREVLTIFMEMMRENPATLVLAPVGLLIPLTTLVHRLLEARFARHWTRKFDASRGTSTGDLSPFAPPVSEEALA